MQNIDRIAFQFIWRWYLRIWECPHALHPFSQKFPLCCLLFSSKAGLIDEGYFSSSQGKSLCSLSEPLPSWRSTGRCPRVAFCSVSVLVWSTRAPSRTFKEDRRTLPLFKPLSCRRSMGRCPWLCAHREHLKLLSTCGVPRCKPLEVVAFTASLSARSFPLTGMSRTIHPQESS